MSVTIHFGDYFNENTTVAEIRNIFAKDDGKLYRMIDNDNFGSSDINATLASTIMAFFAGIEMNQIDTAKACGYVGEIGAWQANIYNGCFGSSRQFAKHPSIEDWRQHIRDLLSDIAANRDTYTAGDVYRMIESDPLWQNSYTGENKKHYKMEIARKNLLALVSDPENFEVTKQQPSKRSKRAAATNPTQSGPEESELEENDSGKALPKDPTQATLVDLIRNGQYQIVLTGAPGTGKTFSAGEVVNWFYDEGIDPNNIEKVQFHPSYDYTDFVEGLRPVMVKTTNEKGESVEQMQFRRVDGSFMRFCRYVAWQNEMRAIREQEKSGDNEVNEEAKDNPLYFFLIDEINRADLSKVFGELMFAMEGDKRGTTVSTQYSNLETHFTEDEKERDSYYRTCFYGGFFIPENIVIIGTMNDIDRSVESMDFAMRRRFVWVDVLVTKELLISAFESDNFSDTVKKHAKELAQRVVDFNEVLHNPKGKYGLNTDYDISQGQFSGMKEKKFDSLDQLMAWVWKYRVKLLLKEYLRGRLDGDMDEELRILENIWMKKGTASAQGSKEGDS